MRPWLALVVATVLSLLVIRAAPGGVMYTVTSLGPSYNTPYAINSSGQVTGEVSDPSQVAYLYTPGDGLQHLGILPGGTASTGLGLNDSGVVVGVSFTQGYSYSGFVYSNGAMQGLGTFGGTESVAAGVNSGGVVVGRANDASETPHAFTYVGGVMHDLGPGGANAINKAGQIVGFNGASHAALFSGGTVADLGTLPGDTTSDAVAINQSGQTVGYSYPAGGATRGFIYDGGTMRDLGNLGGTGTEATGINDYGQVVGFTATSAQHGVAFLYQNGVMTDLNTLIDPNSGWALAGASAINDLGQITGEGYLNNSTEQGFLLTPVPEPATPVMALLGVLGTLHFSRRRRAITH